jgi:hypothetical protein
MGFGWVLIGKAGQLLERSIVDRTVAGPERLVFEGAPILEPPLEQDVDSRRPDGVAGETVDTSAACPPLTAAEQKTVDKLKTAAIWQVQPTWALLRTRYISEVLAHSRGGVP